MLLAFDIGNTNISVGVFDLSEHAPMLRASFHIASDTRSTRDEYIMRIHGLLSLRGFSADAITDAAVSSVVPSLTDVITDVAQFFSSRRPLVIGPGIRTGLNIRIDQQTQLGSDIVANAVAALARTDVPAVIVDFGTATTFAVIDASSALSGAIICPGLRVSMDALADSASLLMDSDMARPTSIVGKNTRDSVSSGIINGHIIMVDGFIRELRQTLCADSDRKISLIATGGMVQYVAPYCRNKFTIVPALTLEGIAEIFVRNFV